jgi:peroxiredoxin
MYPMASPLITQSWLNAADDFSLAALRGRVVLVEVFQMLCPGCVSHALPQAQKAVRQFAAKDFALIGLHSVFEHHRAQGSREALAAFAHEYRLQFPIGIDAPGDSDGVPQTMRRYTMRGTPTMLLIDREGRLRIQHFGVLEDMALGAMIMSVIAEGAAAPAQQGERGGTDCDDSGCARL